MNEAKSFETDLHLASKLGELSNSEWNQDEKNALLQSAKFIKEWTNLRSSILFHMLDNGEEATEEAQSRIQYWKDVMDGKNRSTPELPSTISKGNKDAAKEILESYRRELAKDILKKAGALQSAPLLPQPALSTAPETIPEIKQTTQKSAPITANDITVIEEDYIAEFVATHSGNELDEFYHKHLIPAYKAVLSDLQDRIKNKPAHIPLDKFQKSNEIFLIHAEFLRSQIKLVREKEPTVDSPIPVLTDIVELGTKPVTTAPLLQQTNETSAEAAPPAQAHEITLSKTATATPDPKKPSLVAALGSGLKSLFNSVAKTITDKLLPRPRLGLEWSMATGAGLAAGVALATAMHTGDVHNHYPKQIRSLTDNEPKATTVAEAKILRPSLESSIALDAHPATTNDLAAKPAKSAPPKLVILSTKTFMKQPKIETFAPEPTREAPQQLAEAKPIEQKSFDIETFRMDLSTLEKACRQVGKGTQDGICNDLQPQ